MTDTPLLTTKEVAKRARLSEAYVIAHSKKAEPRIPSYFFGRVRRFRAEDVDAFIEQHRVAQ